MDNVAKDFSAHSIKRDVPYWILDSVVSYQYFRRFWGRVELVPWRLQSSSMVTLPFWRRPFERILDPSPLFKRTFFQDSSDIKHFYTPIKNGNQNSFFCAPFKEEKLHPIWAVIFRPRPRLRWILQGHILLTDFWEYGNLGAMENLRMNDVMWEKWTCYCWWLKSCTGW